MKMPTAPKDVKPPKALADLYRDLRDRRLLIPAAALLIAIIGVVVLLPSSPAPVAQPAATEVEATAATPAVFAEQAGIRDYRKRLRALKKKNPFDQKFAVPEPAAAAATGEPSAVFGPPDDGATEPAAAGAPASGSDTATSASTPSGAVGSGGSPGMRKPRVEQVWWTWEVDLTFGRVGDTKQRDGVGALDLLPSRKNPLVAFLGAGPNGKRATFLISDAVTSSRGDGRCAPSKANCYFVRLKPGEGRRLTVAPEEGPTVNYRLAVRSINEKVVKRSDK